LECLAGAVAAVLVELAFLFEIGGQGEGSVEQALLGIEAGRDPEGGKALIDQRGQVVEVGGGEIGRDAVGLARDGEVDWGGRHGAGWYHSAAGMEMVELSIRSGV
jgi:hypothetical protein